jgi:general secretion pathway protein F/type IV pilus assembly protein PilC
MPIYDYRALDEYGKKIKGVIDADSLFLAKEKLKQLRAIPVSLSEITLSSKELRLSTSRVLAFTRELSQLLKAGLPLYESLLTIEEKYRKNKEHTLFLQLCEAVKNGKALSFALSKYPKTFDAIYISMVASAEEAGALAEIFE